MEDISLICMIQRVESRTHIQYAWNIWSTTGFLGRICTTQILHIFITARNDLDHLPDAKKHERMVRVVGWWVEQKHKKTADVLFPRKTPYQGRPEKIEGGGGVLMSCMTF